MPPQEADYIYTKGLDFLSKRFDVEKCRYMTTIWEGLGFVGIDKTL